MKFYAEINKYYEQADGTLMVSGMASSETKDSQGEIVKADAMRNAMPDFMRDGTGPLREMHQPSAAGCVMKADVNEDGNTYIEAKVVDPVAILKIKEGVYKGFSVGGKTIAKADGIITKMRLTEISLVDRPANPECLIDLYKADMDIEGEETDLAKYAGEEAWDAQRAIECLNAIYSLYSKESTETEQEPEQVSALKAVIDNLKAFIASEIMESSEENTPDNEAIEMADMPESLLKLADILNKGDLTPDAIIELIEGDVINKAAQCDDITKLNDEMDIVKADLVKAQTEAAEWKAKWDARPNYGDAILKAVTKDDDNGKVDPAEAIAKSIEAMPENERATALIKLIHQQGR